MDNNVITDIRIPFWRLVVIFVKWAIAAIPATIIVVVLYGLVLAVLGDSWDCLAGRWAVVPSSSSPGRLAARSQHPSRHRVELRHQRRVAGLGGRDDGHVEGAV